MSFVTDGSTESRPTRMQPTRDPYLVGRDSVEPNPADCYFVFAGVSRIPSR